MGGAFSQLAVFEAPGQVQGLTRKRLRRYPSVWIRVDARQATKSNPANATFLGHTNL